jgi:beta-lactam-binding protein with PASTA domain
VVPKLKGKTLTAATRALKAHFCSLGKVSRSFSTTVKRGRVIAQKPRPGKQLQHGGKVRLTISKGSSR